MTAPPILFAGDPHRNFSPILRACLRMQPGTLILLGDCDCPQPLPAIMAPALAAGWDVRWILGNHDTETEAAFHNLTARELLERLQDEQPGAYAVGLLRTLQRRLKGWRGDKAHELVFGATRAGSEPVLPQLQSVT